MEAVRTWRWWWQQWRPVTCTASRSPMIFSVKSCHGRTTFLSWRSTWMITGDGPTGSVFPPSPGTNLLTMFAWPAATM